MLRALVSALGVGIVSFAGENGWFAGWADSGAEVTKLFRGLIVVLCTGPGGMVSDDGYSSVAGASPRQRCQNVIFSSANMARTTQL